SGALRPGRRNRRMPAAARQHPHRRRRRGRRGGRHDRLTAKTHRGKGKHAMSGKSRKIAVCGLLGALALVLTLLEGMLPPIPGLPPGARPGLSNIVTMFAAGSLGLPYALAIALLKGVFAFLTRGVTAGLMSLSGGLMSTLAMWVVWKKTRFSLLFTGVC